MTLTFRATDDPSDAQIEKIAELYPESPFVTPAFCSVRRDLGAEPVTVTLEDGDTIATGCIAFLTRGRLNTRLEIISLPPLADRDLFWTNLFERCRKQAITWFDVNTFASTTAELPSSPSALTRQERREFRIDLTKPDLWALLNRRHRRMVTRAREAGLELQKSNDPEDAGTHVALANLTLGRLKKKGAAIDSEINKVEIEKFLAYGVGDLYRVVKGDEIMGTLFIAKSRTGAYAQSSGTSDNGRAVGASHFLFHEVACRLKDESLRVFNIGGVEEKGSGLSEFKIGFGSEQIDLASAEYYLGGALRMIATKAKSLFIGT